MILNDLSLKQSLKNEIEQKYILYKNKFSSCILLKLVLSYTLHYYGSLDFKLENQRLKALKMLGFR